MSLDEKIESLMSKDVSTMNADGTVQTAAVTISKMTLGCIIVVRSRMAVGIVTEQDIVAKVTANGVDPAKVFVRDIMSTPLISVKADQTIKEAVGLMSRFKIRRLPVVGDGGELAGVVTAEHIADWLARLKEYKDPAMNAFAKSGSPYQ